MREMDVNELMAKAGARYALLIPNGEDEFVFDFFRDLDTAEYCVRTMVDLDESAGHDAPNYEVVRVVPVPTATPAPLEREDVMQALCAAMFFAEPAGYGAAHALHAHEVNGAELVAPVDLRAGTGASVRVDPNAARLLAAAYAELPVRVMGVAAEGGRTDYDLRMC